jgi:hypothetical protein
VAPSPALDELPNIVGVLQRNGTRRDGDRILDNFAEISKAPTPVSIGSRSPRLCELEIEALESAK